MLKKTLTTTIIALLLLPAAYGTAEAKDTLMFTPAASAGTGGTIKCTVVNISDKEIPGVFITVFSSSGFNSESCTPVNASNSTAGICTLSLTGSGQRRCRVFLQGASKKQVLVTLSVEDANGATILSLPGIAGK